MTLRSFHISVPEQVTGGLFATLVAGIVGRLGSKIVKVEGNNFFSRDALQLPFFSRRS